MVNILTDDNADTEKINGGHKYGVQIGPDLYYYADKVWTNPYGKLEWECEYDNRIQRCKIGPEGEVIIEYEVK